MHHTPLGAPEELNVIGSVGSAYTALLTVLPIISGKLNESLTIVTLHVRIGQAM